LSSEKATSCRVGELENLVAEVGMEAGATVTSFIWGMKEKMICGGRLQFKGGNTGRGSRVKGGKKKG